MKDLLDLMFCPLIASSDDPGGTRNGRDGVSLAPHIVRDL